MIVSIALHRVFEEGSPQYKMTAFWTAGKRHGTVSANFGGDEPAALVQGLRHIADKIEREALGDPPLRILPLSPKEVSTR